MAKKNKSRKSYKDNKHQHTRNTTVYLVLDTFPTQQRRKEAEDWLKLDGYLAIRPCYSRNLDRVRKKGLRIAGWSKDISEFNIVFCN